MTNALPGIDAPRCKLFNDPTPLQLMRKLGAKLGCGSLYIKRDDHVPIALGGNKLRSLEFWLGAACHANADIVIVAGGATSNLCRLTAAAASMVGLDCIVLHNSLDTEENRQKSFLNKVFGAEVRFLGAISEQERRDAATSVAAELIGRGRAAYIVGNEVVGALGYVSAAFELQEQSLQLENKIKHVILPGSMGPTEAGLIFGNMLLGNPFVVHLVSVEYERSELAARVKEIYEGLQRYTGLGIGFEGLPIHYHMECLGDGYGSHSKEGEQAILALARSEGILMEYVYTAKTLAGFIRLVSENQIPVSEPACVIHTGGVPSLFTQFDMFQSINWDERIR